MGLCYGEAEEREFGNIMKTTWSGTLCTMAGLCLEIVLFTLVFLLFELSHPLCPLQKNNGVVSWFLTIGKIHP